MADSLKQVLYNEISAQKDGSPIVISELIKDTADSDSSILLLMVQNNASKAIVIKYLNVFFDQTDVEVTKEGGGKQRAASFDICAVINYQLYNREAKIDNSDITVCEFFTTRNVLSGLLAADRILQEKGKGLLKLSVKMHWLTYPKKLHGNKRM